MIFKLMSIVDLQFIITKNQQQYDIYKLYLSELHWKGPG